MKLKVGLSNEPTGKAGVYWTVQWTSWLLKKNKVSSRQWSGMWNKGFSQKALQLPSMVGDINRGQQQSNTGSTITG